jgi:hypothetical protein
MSKTATLAAQPTRSFLDRLLSFLDHAAELAVENVETIYFGL